MEKLTWAVDFEDCYLTERCEYIAAGWAITDQLQACEVSVTTETGDHIPAEIRITRRSDVEELMAQLPILEEIGFYITIANIDKLKEKGATSICLRTAVDGTEYLLHQRSIEDIYKLGQKKSIRIEVDSILEKNEYLTFVGWIYNIGHKEWCTVKDDDGKEYSFDLKRVKRPDVISHFHMREGFKAGFEITLKEKPQKEHLVITVKNEYAKAEKELEIPVRGMKKKLEKLFHVEKPETPEEQERRESHVNRYGETDYIYELRKKENLALSDYDIYRERHKVSEKELAAQRKHRFEYNPKISICIPLYNTPLNFLKELIDSVRSQTYPNWQLCLGDASTEAAPGEFIKKHYKKDSRIVYQVLKENAGISLNTNAAVEFSDGEFIMFSDHDDMLEPNALFEIVSRLQDRDVDVVYTDEDKMDMDGKLFYEPNFKPDFNLYYLRSCNYITHIFVAKRDIVDEVGLLDPRCDGAQDYDYIFRCCEKATKIAHVPMILYHWRCHPASTAGNPESKMYAYESGVHALQGHYDRLGIAAKAGRSQWLGHYTTEFTEIPAPLITIILSDARFADYTKKCITDIQKTADYDNLEFIVSCRPDQEEEYEALLAELEKKKIIRRGQARLQVLTEGLNHALRMNRAVDLAKGEYLLFMDAQLTPKKENWLRELLGYCLLSDVGAVGTKLLMGYNRIWHAGIVVGLGRDHAGANLLYGQPDELFSYQGRSEVTLETTAVSSCCMMISRKLYSVVGGMETAFSDIFMEMDFCLRLKKAGKKVIYNPYACMQFFGLFSRTLPSGAFMGPAYADMCTAFTNKWRKELEKVDPLYNPNLSSVRTDCSVRS